MRQDAVCPETNAYFLRVISQRLQSSSPAALSVDKVALHIGAVAFIHRIGSSRAIVGRTDRPHLHGVPALVPDVRRPDASDCVHHAQFRHQAKTESHRGGVKVIACNPGTRALWGDCDLQADECADGEPDLDLAVQPVPDYAVD